ncbi:glycosyltransferase family 2 protein [Candidatus Dojkabacteria bacterium]|nr:glycosyltransferase family 2 protein [Candidatus Dojkabacteria bacterium]
MKITAVVPNYNGSSNISNILKQLSNEHFDQIYLIDDNSTDNSVEIAKTFPKVTVIENNVNVGPGANRSRILKYPHGDIIFFVDVDMEILVADVTEKIEELFKDKSIDLVGGMIITKKDEPMWWNWGYEMNLSRDTKARKVDNLMLKHWTNLEKIVELKRKYPNISPNLDISFSEHALRKVDWVSEANFCVKSKVFEEVGGFDPKMWYHADQDLCKRVREAGYGVYYCPTIKVKHLEIDTFGKDRVKTILKNTLYYYKKHIKTS